ncbi:MAG: hypothetical protein EZS28_045362, partial [Streblomastix strix]
MPIKVDKRHGMMILQVRAALVKYQAQVDQMKYQAQVVQILLKMING